MKTSITNKYRYIHLSRPSGARALVTVDKIRAVEEVNPDEDLSGVKTVIIFGGTNLYVRETYDEVLALMRGEAPSRHRVSQRRRAAF